MNSKFIYSIPTTVYFGEDRLANLADELKKYGRNVLMLYGGGSIKRIGLYDRITEALSGVGLNIVEFGGIEPNPRHTSCNAAIAVCKREKIDVLLAVGGGSVIDAAKFIGAGTFYDGDVWDILTEKATITDCLPIVTVLTLSATGSEMDTGGVISNMQTHEKIGLLNPKLLPKASFLDPTNTYSVSAFQTACGACDILSHIFEVYFNHTPDLYMLDRMMEALIKTVIQYAPIAIKHPNDYEARANLMWASSWAINGFINGGKNQEWTCHPIEHELSAFYDITHGLGLAIVTPRWMEYVLDEVTAPRFYTLGINVFGIDCSLDKRIVAEQTIEKLKEFMFGTLGLKSTLGEIGIGSENFAVMAKKACGGGVINGYKRLDASDIETILNMCK